MGKERCYTHFNCFTKSICGLFSEISLYQTHPSGISNFYVFSGPSTSWQIDAETVETVTDFIFWAPKLLQMMTAAMKLKDTYSLEGKLLPP